MNERQKSLFQLLVTHHERPLKVKNMAEELACSEKTVRNDLKEIEIALEKFPQSHLLRIHGVGIQFVIDEAEHKHILNFINQFNIRQTDDSSQLLTTAVTLLSSGKPITLTALADELYSNKSTIRIYLQTIEKWLEQFNLKLISKQRVGSHIEGLELDKRNALAHVYSLIEKDNSTGNHDVLKLFPAHEIGVVRRALADISTNFSIHLSDGEYESLTIHALIMIRRTHHHAHVDIDKSDMHYNTDTNLIANYFLQKIEHMLHISFPMSEYIYIAWHLESYLSKQEENPNIEEIKHIVKQMARQLQFMAMYPFTEDETLMNGLATHLQSTYSRLRHGLIVDNPMLDSIKRTYPYMFSIVDYVLQDIQKQFELTISEDEAAYIVLHFQAAIERIKRKQTEQRQTIIVCEHGTGMSFLLQAKIEQLYTNIQIKACLSKNDLESYLKLHHVDFIITTIDIPEQSLPSIYVSPLLNDIDKEKLNTFLNKVNQERNVSSHNLTTLYSFLKSDINAIHLKKNDPYEIIKQLTEKLIDHDYVEEGFLTSVMEREKRASTEIGGEIAIPHADGKYVKKSAISFATLKSPVTWGNESVSIVFLLAITKSDRHHMKDFMKLLAELTQQPRSIFRLKQAGTENDIIAFFRQ